MVQLHFHTHNLQASRNDAGSCVFQNGWLGLYQMWNLAFYDHPSYLLLKAYEHKNKSRQWTKNGYFIAKLIFPIGMNKGGNSLFIATVHNNYNCFFFYRQEEKYKKALTFLRKVLLMQLKRRAFFGYSKQCTSMYSAHF